jgi:predicted dehydrogenase
MARTRIAVAGAGLIGRAHAAAVRASATLELASIVDPSPAAAPFAAQAGVACFTSLDELIERDRPDGVVLATPNALHVPQAMQCIAAGLPALVEKPVATGVTEGAALLAAAREAGFEGRLLVGHHRAHSPIMAQARQVVASGRLGRLVAVTGSAMFFKPDAYFAEGPWRTQPGGGPILINMIHEVHNLRLLAGEIVAVQAFASNASRGLAVEDTVAIGLRFADGALGTFVLSDTAASPKSWEQTARENPAYAAVEGEDCYVVTGTNGSLSVPTMKLYTYPRPQGRSWYEPFEVEHVPLERDDSIALQMEHFGAVVRGEAAPLVTVRDGLANLRVTEAIVSAAATGRTVDLPPDEPAGKARPPTATQ